MAAGGSAGAESGYWKLGVELLILFERQMERHHLAAASGHKGLLVQQHSHANDGQKLPQQQHEGTVALGPLPLLFDGDGKVGLRLRVGVNVSAWASSRHGDQLCGRSWRGRGVCALLLSSSLYRESSAIGHDE